MLHGCRALPKSPPHPLIARLLWHILNLALLDVGLTAPPAEAATTLTTTRSCVAAPV